MNKYERVHIERGGIRLIRNPRIYLEDILLEIKRIRSFTEEIKSSEDLENLKMSIFP